MGTIHARLAHVGVYAHDQARMEKFYTTVLGLMITDKGKGRAGVELTFMSGNPDNPPAQFSAGLEGRLWTPRDLNPDPANVVHGRLAVAIA